MTQLAPKQGARASAPARSRPSEGRFGDAAGGAEGFSHSHPACAALICASAFLLAGAPLRAATVCDAQARLAASAFAGRTYAPADVAKGLGRLPAPGVLTVSGCAPIGSPESPDGFAVKLSPSGYVVIRADDELPPVKLHAASGSYEELPPGFRAVIETELAGERADLAALRQAKGSPEPRFRWAWRSLTQSEAWGSALSAEAPDAKSAVSNTVLLVTTWNQMPPYNVLMPVASGGYEGRAPAGCGPCAMAQIVRYHKLPAAPAADISYQDGAGYCTGTYRVSDQGGLARYDWANMPTNLTAASSAAQKEAVSRLMFHCGVALEADYEAKATSVISYYTAAKGFRTVFGYTCEEFQSRASYATAEWLAKVRSDIDARRPIYYTMVSALGGHAVVCDGYRDGNEVHFNFGVSGYGNAWYNIDAVVFYGYNWTSHEGVFGIAPDSSAASNTLSVVSGAGSGDYLAGTAVQVTADEPPEEHFFSRWSVAPEETDLGPEFVATQQVASVRMPNHDATLTAVYKTPNQKPVFTKAAPTNALVSLGEGSSVAFSASATDASDPDAATRGMVSVTWYVDGVEKQKTVAGAPSAIASAFTLKTDTGTVVNAAFRDVAVKVAAADVGEGVTETNWVVRVTNAAAAQTIAFPTLAVKALGDADFDPGAKATSGLAVEYTSGNEAVATVAGGLLRITGAGTAEITARQPGSYDYRAATPVKRILTVKARVTAEVPEGGGTVTGAGLYSPGATVTLTATPSSGNTLLNWEDGSQATTRRLVMPNANVTVAAHFGLTANIPAPVIANPGALRLTVGVAVTQALTVTSASLPTVTVTGLPSGLSYSAAAKAIAGVPAVSVTNKLVTVTARNAGGSAAPVSFLLTAEPLPAWAQGSFSGWFEHGALGEGAAVMDVTSLGKVTGKLSAGGTNYSFSAGSYARFEGDGSLRLSVLAKYGAAVSLPLALKVAPAAREAGAEWLPESLSAAEGRFGLSENGPADAMLFRSVWKDAGLAAVLTNRYAGYYTATLPVTREAGSAGRGYLALTVDKAGAVKTAGKLADGTALSLSGTLVADGAGRTWTVLYAAPAAYKGGQFFGVAEFVKPADGGAVFVRPLDLAPLKWSSRSPLATAEYGAGFTRDTGLSGGWYDKVGNLYRYYAGQALAVAVQGMEVPALTVGSNRYDSVWYDPSGLAITPVTNSLGVLTGMKAPAAGTPTKIDGQWVYDAADNTVGMTFALTRATGLFTGTFKAWFDYGITHTSKSIAFQGILTPVREDPSDGWAGGGYFLWADKSAYRSATGATVAYTFSWSYDFLLLSSGPAE